MGTWGAGLYSGDFAADLRSTIGAVARLPFDVGRLVDIIVEAEPDAARNVENEDHTIFWLILADRFARLGLSSPIVIETALRIIDSGQDLEMQARLGQSAAGLKKRRQALAELRDRISHPPVVGPRKALKKPQTFMMDVGEVIRYPTCDGDNRNPYTADPNRLKIYGPGGGQPWFQNGWAAFAIVERGLTFGFFAWYRPVVVRSATADPPELAALLDQEWVLQTPGTCSTLHATRMGFDTVGRLDIDVDKLHRLHPGLRPGDSAAISDITIANRLQVARAGSTQPPYVRRNERVLRLPDLAR